MEEYKPFENERGGYKAVVRFLPTITNPNVGIHRSVHWLEPDVAAHIKRKEREKKIKRIFNEN